jgi:hypothetical protein
LTGYFPLSPEHLVAQFRYTVNQPNLSGNGDEMYQIKSKKGNEK